MKPVMYGFETVIIFHTEEVWDNAVVSKAVENALTASGLKIVKTDRHEFTPQGLTQFWILEESHVALSTWPERYTGLLNIFVCDVMFSPTLFVEELRKGFMARFTVSFCEKVFEL